jgi:adenosylcobinamide-GDP ribazoletransferase
VAGLRLAVSWLTVLPVRADRVDRATARAAIAIAPLVGLLLGGIAAAALAGLDTAGLPPLLAGVLAVALLALLTRGMHLDGLADTADGLGCYGPPERALAVMRDGGAGPFAVVSLIVVLGAQAVAMGALVADGRWAAVVLALTAGRAAFGLCCRRGVPAARADGLGALVAGSQPVLVSAVWWLGLAGAGVLVAPGLLWLGPVAVTVAAALVLALVRHARRRLGGITGDVLGAACELAVTCVLVVCSTGLADAPATLPQTTVDQSVAGCGSAAR